MVRRKINPRWLRCKHLKTVIRWPWQKADRRKRLIRRRGLPVKVTVEWLGSLLILAFKPLRGFVHLVKKKYVKETTRRYGPYHLSLCHWEYFTDECYAALRNLQRRWHGWEGIVQVADVLSDGYLLVGGELGRDQAVRLLHQSGKYRDWGLHISA